MKGQVCWTIFQGEKDSLRSPALDVVGAQVPRYTSQVEQSSVRARLNPMQ